MTDEPIRFFLPGPTYVRRDVREAMLADLIGHRSAAMKRLYESVAPKLPPIFRTTGDVYIATSSATMVMQSAIMSTAPERVLHLICGAFSRRWYDISVSLGRQADKVEVPWGEAIDPDLVRQALERRRYDAVAFAHNETSTGVLNPAREISATVRQESEALVLVDTVSSLAGVPVEIDDWGLDVVLTGSQKALSIPPGLAFFTLSERAVERAESTQNRGLYTDLLRYRSKHQASGTITTPAISTLYAADVQLGHILEEGIEARWERHRRCQQMVGEWAERRGFSFVPATHRSPTVSCLRPPVGIDPPGIGRRPRRGGLDDRNGLRQIEAGGDSPRSYGRSRPAAPLRSARGDRRSGGSAGLTGGNRANAPDTRCRPASPGGPRSLGGLRCRSRHPDRRRAPAAGRSCWASTTLSWCAVPPSSPQISCVESERLKVVARAGIGVDNIDVAAATERGVLVVNSPTANLLSAAEHTFALMLALARNVPAADRSMKAGVWDQKELRRHRAAGQDARHRRLWADRPTSVEPRQGVRYGGPGPRPLPRRVPWRATGG